MRSNMSITTFATYEDVLSNVFHPECTEQKIGRQIRSGAEEPCCAFQLKDQVEHVGSIRNGGDD